MEWKPIETAPKDGTEILATCQTKKGSWTIHTMYWGEYYGKMVWRGWPRGPSDSLPTYWTPISYPVATQSDNQESL